MGVTALAVADLVLASEGARLTEGRHEVDALVGGDRGLATVGADGLLGEVRLAARRVAVVDQDVDVDRFVGEGVGEVVAGERGARECLGQHRDRDGAEGDVALAVADLVGKGHRRCFGDVGQVGREAHRVAFDHRRADATGGLIDVQQRDAVAFGVDVVGGDRDLDLVADDDPLGIGVGDGWAVGRRVVEAHREHVAGHVVAGDVVAERVGHRRQLVGPGQQRDLQLLADNGGHHSTRGLGFADRQIVAVWVDVVGAHVDGCWLADLHANRVGVGNRGLVGQVVAQHVDRDLRLLADASLRISGLILEDVLTREGGWLVLQCR